MAQRAVITRGGWGESPELPRSRRANTEHTSNAIVNIESRVQGRAPICSFLRKAKAKTKRQEPHPRARKSLARSFPRPTSPAGALRSSPYYASGRLPLDKTPFVILSNWLRPITARGKYLPLLPGQNHGFVEYGYGAVLAGRGGGALVNPLTRTCTPSRTSTGSREKTRTYVRVIDTFSTLFQRTQRGRLIQ